MKKVYLSRDGQVAGPYEYAAVMQMLQDNKLKTTDYIMFEGDSNWSPVSKLNSGVATSGHDALGNPITVNADAHLTADQQWALDALNDENNLKNWESIRTHTVDESNGGNRVSDRKAVKLEIKDMKSNSVSDKMTSISMGQTAFNTAVNYNMATPAKIRAGQADMYTDEHYDRTGDSIGIMNTTEAVMERDARIKLAWQKSLEWLIVEDGNHAASGFIQNKLIRWGNAFFFLFCFAPLQFIAIGVGFVNAIAGAILGAVTLLTVLVVIKNYSMKMLAIRKYPRARNHKPHKFFWKLPAYPVFVFLMCVYYCLPALHFFRETN